MEVSIVMGSWGVPNSWMIFWMGKSIKIDAFGVPPLEENPSHGVIWQAAAASKRAMH